MSVFRTKIPVDVAAIIAALPKRSFVKSAALAADRKSVEIEWGCDALQTGVTFAREASVESLPELREKVAAIEAAKAAPGMQSPPVQPQTAQIGNVNVDNRRRRGRTAAV